ncbi:MAG: hypothetical protein EAY75_14865 [Bacteroidetes bacterium]|nr:MAG: hypothetical protein EAY75_14865 [Bacteroidota bacterium]
MSFHIVEISGSYNLETVQNYGILRHALGGIKKKLQPKTKVQPLLWASLHQFKAGRKSWFYTVMEFALARIFGRVALRPVGGGAASKCPVHRWRYALGCSHCQ